MKTEKRLNSFFSLSIFKSDVFSGVLLAIAAILSLLVANSFLGETYYSFLNYKVFNLDLKHWVNDGLMAIFFFYVGLEIKKEIVSGELSSFKKALFPFFAALGGMIVPALLYFLLNSEGPQAAGWGIPMATDIAFALGFLSLFGKKVPLGLKVFLLSIAIVDDLGAILVIAFFYTQNISILGLFIAAIGLGLTITMQKYKINYYTIYILLGAMVWFGFLKSGIHATIAGVLMGLLTPINIKTKTDGKEQDQPLVAFLLHKLHLWVNLCIMPIFAFFNAGISFEGVNFSGILDSPIFRGILLGLFTGKPLGVLLFSYLAAKLKMGIKSDELKWSYIVAVGCFAGIGFTMSLFISSLALAENLQVYSKSGILFASLLSAIAGCLVLFFSLKVKNEMVV